MKRRQPDMKKHGKKDSGLNKKREKEMRIVSEMIGLYCRKKHGSKGLCPECEKLASYAAARIEHCPMMETKTFCSSCRIHCYQKEMREKIREVMRFSGPRMLFYHPVMAIWHVVCSMKERNQNL